MLNVHIRSKFNIKRDFFMAVLFALFIARALKIDIWWLDESIRFEKQEIIKLSSKADLHDLCVNTRNV